MECNTTWEDPLMSYVKSFDGLIGDKRTGKTFRETVKGIIAAGSLICQQIAAQSAELSKGKKGPQRVIRLATGASTQRSRLDAQHLTQRLREVAVEQLEQAPEDEVWLIAERRGPAQTLGRGHALAFCKCVTWMRSSCQATVHSMCLG
jgi:hypothetical protein